MNSNFNMVKKPKKEKEIIEEEEEVVLEEEKKAKENSAAKKKMIRFMLIIIVITILFLIILYLCSIFINRTYSYTELENILKNAAVSYFKDNPNNLPSEDGDVVEIDAGNLIAAEKMKDLSEYTKEGVSCSGSVQVERTGTRYLYTPYLNCGESYVTEELYKKVIDDDNIVTSGYGLYAVNGAYVFRGENVNNYVKLGKSLWRIVKVSTNNNVVLISEDGLPTAQPWDNRYNDNRNYESGINQYSASRVKEFLDVVYSKTLTEDGEQILSKKDKTKIVSFNLCTGKRDENSEVNDNSEECGEVLQNQKLGLLTLSDYISASVDPKCKSIATKSCKNYNYLSKDFDWWLVTANKADDSTVFKVDSSGIVSSDNASIYSIIRPIIYLNSKVLYKSGKGTFDKPYKVK